MKNITCAKEPVKLSNCRGCGSFFARSKEVVQYLEKAGEWPEHESEEEHTTAQ